MYGASKGDYVRAALVCVAIGAAATLGGVWLVSLGPLGWAVLGGIGVLIVGIVIGVALGGA
jgi:hypothetical protein